MDVYKYFAKFPEGYKVTILTILKDLHSFKEIRNYLESIEIEKFKNSRTEKNAIISSNRWVERIIQLEPKIAAFTEFKFFKMNEKAKAIEWLKQ